VSISEPDQQLVDTEEKEPLVEMLFRNGTLTVVGILLSFSLTFITQWAHNPIPWELVDLPAIGLLVAGIAGQAYALVILLRHDSLRRPVYDKGTRFFIIGLCLTASGVVASVIIDFLQIVA
jgi:hypothetical protein